MWNELDKLSRKYLPCTAEFSLSLITQMSRLLKAFGLIYRKKYEFFFDKT